MSLREYVKKRILKGPEASPEPPAIKKESPEKKLIFVVHEHKATHLHWDLRLEMNQVLKSWAIPKKPPRVKGIKRLAIQVEDHPLGYAEFEGVIPEGHYGAGSVKIWDKGTYKIESKTKEKIILFFNGKKLKGRYALIKTSYGKSKKNWLFFKF